MPGMNSGVDAGHPTLAAAFEAALVRQGMVVLLVLWAVGLAWLGRRAWARRPATGAGQARAPGAGVPLPADPAGRRVLRTGAARMSGIGVLLPAEPAGRRVLRIGFGLLWLFDSVLQAQPKMPAGLASQVIVPGAASSPHWLQHLVGWGVTAWSHHPVQAAAAVVWIEAGIGIWMLVAARGTWSRLSGLAGAGWGLTVWVFGESFGGIFAPGLSWLTGAPGAAGCYVAAGALVALPGRAWQSPRLGRLVLAGLGLFLAGMAVLQAWPGRGSWSGTAAGRPGPLADMVRSMSAVPQPKFLADWVAGFGTFAAGHGFPVNLFAVAALVVIGLAFASGRRPLVRPAIIGFTLLCLADWVLVQDLGFFGGVGTDPGSMIPFVLLAVAGYLALTRVPAVLPVPVSPAPAASGPATRGRCAQRPGPAAAVRDHRPWRLPPGPGRQSASSQPGRRRAAGGIIRGW
jgi:hypothetical protein